MWVENNGILHNAEFDGFHSSPNIMLATCSVLLLLLLLLQEEKDEACGQHRRGRNCFKRSLGKHEENRIFGTYRNVLENYIKAKDHTKIEFRACV
jgi:hypothetical protein